MTKAGFIWDVKTTMSNELRLIDKPKRLVPLAPGQSLIEFEILTNALTMDKLKQFEYFKSRNGGGRFEIDFTTKTIRVLFEHIEKCPNCQNEMTVYKRDSVSDQDEFICNRCKIRCTINYGEVKGSKLYIPLR